MCLVTLVVILALRIGNIAARSYAEVITLMKSRVDRRMIWLHPEWPLISGKKPRSVLQIGTPAGPKQMGETLTKAALLAGYHEKLVTHDVRRGATKDLSLTDLSVGSTTDGVAMRLGHSHGAQQMGVTRRYVGAPTYSDWGKRLALDDDDPFEICPLTSRFDSGTRLSSSEVDAWCARLGRDPTSRAARSAAADHGRREKKDIWRATAWGGPSNTPTAPEPPYKKSKLIIPEHPNTGRFGKLRI